MIVGFDRTNYTFPFCANARATLTDSKKKHVSTIDQAKTQVQTNTISGNKSSTTIQPANKQTKQQKKNDSF